MTDGTASSADGIIDELIGTYRELNLRVRPLSESVLAADRGGTSVRAIVQEMRDRELLFAQSLKERTSSFEPTTEVTNPPITGLETDEDSTAMLISQFGTARGTTLSTLKALPAAAWETPGSDGRTLSVAVRELIAQDTEAVNQIVSMLTP
ncbi:MAG: hypothetical protein ACTHMX_08695 [Thermomicrobiales bacterium]|jgi:hypothetical protein